MLCAAACGDDDGVVDGGTEDASMPVIDGCENLNPNHCLLPWPSDTFLVDDPSTPSGRRVALDASRLPMNQFDAPVSSVNAWNRSDGFSALTAAMTLFLGELDTSNLPNELNIGDSLLPDSPTVVLDAETGERVAHFAEIDQWDSIVGNERRSFFVRPAARLQEERRYIVAIREIRRIDGSPVEPSAYFRALRDGEPSEVAEIEARRSHFEDIFATLDTAGVDRDTLVEAWDFTTASGEGAWGEVVALRDDALERIGERGIGCTVESVEEDVNAEVWRRIRGTYTVPLYVENEFEGAIANRNGDGVIEYNGMAEAQFEVVIPFSVRDRIRAGGEPARVIMYGHGLFGLEDQVSSSGTRVGLQALEAVGVGTRFWGWGEEDESWFVNNVIPDYGELWRMMERVRQGIVNSLVLPRTFKGVCSELPELQIDVGGTPMPAYDPSVMYYYGISQGGTMAVPVAVLSPDIERFALQVGGINYPLFISRSFDFRRFERIFENWYTDKIDRDWLIVAMAHAFDPIEPGTYAPHLVRDPLPGAPAKRVMYHIAQYDVQLANIASDYAARTIGLPYFASSVYAPWNLEPTAGPVESGYVIYGLDTVDPAPIGAVLPLLDNDAHEDLRFQPAVLQQLDTFLRPDGQMVDTCPDGSCLLTNVRD